MDETPTKLYVESRIPKVKHYDNSAHAGKLILETCNPHKKSEQSQFILQADEIHIKDLDNAEKCATSYVIVFNTLQKWVLIWCRRWALFTSLVRVALPPDAKGTQVRKPFLVNAAAKAFLAALEELKTLLQSPKAAEQRRTNKRPNHITLSLASIKLSVSSA